MGVFSDDPEVIAAGVAILQLVAIYQVADAATIVLGGSLNGAGDTTYTMLTRLVCAWGLFLPLAYVYWRFLWDWGSRRVGRRDGLPVRIGARLLFTVPLGAVAEVV